MTKTIIILAIATVIVAATLISTTQVFARDIGPIGEFHIENPASFDAFDFEGPSYVLPTDLSADISLGQEFVIGYETMVGLNGAQVANLGLVKLKSISCSDFDTAIFSDTISTLLPGGIVPTFLTVYLVETGEGTKAILQLQEFGVDFTNPNGLKFDYEILSCGLSDAQLKALDSSIIALDDACKTILKQKDNLVKKGETIPIEILELELRACGP